MLRSPARQGAPPSLRKERALVKAGCRHVAGVDEAGRGAWAGPVSAAAVILPTDAAALKRLSGVNDSKQLTVARRESLRVIVMRESIAWAVGFASNDEIDALGILPATRLAMMRAVASLHIAPDALLIDAVKLPGLSIQQSSFNFADSISLSVAAASILAKTARDALMRTLALHTPGYHFDVHKGYGTRLHQAAMHSLGVSAHHRRSFKPVAACPGLA